MSNCVCFYGPVFISISLLISVIHLSWWSRSSCGSSGLSWLLCSIYSNVSQKHSSVKRTSGSSWESEPKLCSNRLWNRKWLLKGGSRCVVDICWRPYEFIHTKMRNLFQKLLKPLYLVFVLTNQTLNWICGFMAGPALGLDPLGGSIWSSCRAVG